MIVLLQITQRIHTYLVHHLNAERGELLMREIQTVRRGVEHMTFLDGFESVLMKESVSYMIQRI